MKDERIKKSFILYLEHHPDQRFWEAIRIWSGFSHILATRKDSGFTIDDLNGIHQAKLFDTFYLEEKPDGTIGG